MPSVLITGSSHGIGMEWWRQYAEADWRVFSTCRRPETAVYQEKFAPTDAFQS